MSDAIPAIEDTARLSRPRDRQPLLERIKELSTQQYITAWMLVEIAAITTLFGEGTITAGEVWRLVLPRYNIPSSVSSKPGLGDDSDWLIPPLADRALVWEHLTTLCAAEEVAPVPALPGPYDLPDTQRFVGNVLYFHVTGLNLLWDRFGAWIGADRFLDRLGYSLRQAIERYLAVQWFGGPMAIGASLHGLPLPGGSFGIEGQPVHVLKALVEALKRDIADYQDAYLVDANSALSRETLGRIQLWWMLVKGYTYDMLEPHQENSVVTMLVGHPALVEDLKTVLTKGLDLLMAEELPLTPEWSGGSSSCKQVEIIGEVTTPALIERLTARLAEAAQLERLRDRR